MDNDTHIKNGKAQGELELIDIGSLKCTLNTTLFDFISLGTITARHRPTLDANTVIINQAPLIGNAFFRWNFSIHFSGIHFPRNSSEMKTGKIYKLPSEINYNLNSRTRLYLNREMLLWTNIGCKLWLDCSSRDPRNWSLLFGVRLQSTIQMGILFRQIAQCINTPIKTLCCPVICISILVAWVDRGWDADEGVEYDGVMEWWMDRG